MSGRISGDNVKGILIPVGLGILAASTAITALAPDSIGWLRVSLFFMGLGSGLFTIPIRCLIQGLPEAGRRGSIQGLAEVMDFVGILLAGPLFFLLEKGLNLSPPMMYASAGVLVALFLVYVRPMASATLPEELEVTEPGIAG